MKKTQEVLGLPIITISDGIEVGKVKCILVNADKGSVDYVIVESGVHVLSARVISTMDIIGMGEYALTIENDSVIYDIGKIPTAIDLLQKNIEVKGAKVLTKKGRLIGEIGDFYFDNDNNCFITGLEYIADITKKNIKIIPRDSVITFGKNIIVVKENVEESLLDNMTNKLFNEISIKEFEISAQQTELAELSGSKMEEIIEEATAPIIDSVTEKNEQKSSTQNLFEQRQNQYLKGRKATKTITDLNGNILIESGEMISEAAIDSVKSNGKLIELVMNNKG